MFNKSYRLYVNLVKYLTKVLWIFLFLQIQFFALAQTNILKTAKQSLIYIDYDFKGNEPLRTQLGFFVDEKTMVTTFDVAQKLATKSNLQIFDHSDSFLDLEKIRIKQLSALHNLAIIEIDSSQADNYSTDSFLKQITELKKDVNMNERVPLTLASTNSSPGDTIRTVHYNLKKDELILDQSIHADDKTFDISFSSFDLQREGNPILNSNGELIGIFQGQFALSNYSSSIKPGFIGYGSSVSHLRDLLKKPSLPPLDPQILIASELTSLAQLAKPGNPEVQYIFGIERYNRGFIRKATEQGHPIAKLYDNSLPLLHEIKKDSPLLISYKALDDKLSELSWNNWSGREWEELSPSDRKQILQLARNLVERGLLQAQPLLARLLLKSENEKTRVEGLQLLGVATMKQGNLQAQYDFAVWSLRAGGKSLETGLQLLETLSTQKGVTQASYDLAKLYSRMQEYEEAAYWMRLVAFDISKNIKAIIKEREYGLNLIRELAVTSLDIKEEKQLDNHPLIQHLTRSLQKARDAESEYKKGIELMDKGNYRLAFSSFRKVEELLGNYYKKSSSCERFFLNSN